MLNFKWLRRKDKPDQFIVEVDPRVSFLMDRSIQHEVIQTVASAIVAEYGKELIQTIIGENKLNEAIKDKVVQRIMGDPRDYQG